MARRALVLLLGLLLGACGAGNSDFNEAQTTYGTTVDATAAFPASAVAAEERLYVGHALAVDGRITAVGADGCEVRLDTEAAPLVVTAARTDAGSCAWRVPAETSGFAVAAGTLRTAGDTLRLPANGVRVTPVYIPEPDP